jgi:IclR family transcriptional regulator, acetate operon repressor
MSEDRLRSVDKIVDFLSLFDGVRTSINVDWATNELQVPRSTLYRLISSLTARQVLTHVGDGTYSLGPWFRNRLGYEFFSPILRAQTTPILKEIGEKTGETALIGMRSGNHLIYVDRVESEHALKALSDVGKPFPLYAGATGKAILAFLSDIEIRGIIEKGRLPSVGPRTITDARRLTEEIAAIRRQGYATSVEEVYAGISAVALPIKGPDGAAVAAISVEAPRDRLTAKLIPGYVKVLRSFEKRMSAILMGSR